MGEVYRARDTKLGREVAIKLLPASFAADPHRLVRFEREARVLASLNHPHIAQIYGLETAPTPFIVMEMVTGETLDMRRAIPFAGSAKVGRWRLTDGGWRWSINSPTQRRPSGSWTCRRRSSKS